MIKKDISVNLLNKNIYFISDIHSNYPALRSVINEIPKDALIICLGDIVGYYINPNEVCELLKERKVVCIKGNHDKYVLNELKYLDAREDKYKIRWTREKLFSSNYMWLKMLPDTLSIKIEKCIGVEKVNHLCQIIQIAHGSPSDVEKYIYPDSDVSFLEEFGYPTLVLGHTHHPMVRHYGEGCVVINPGSVGQPRDRIPGACFASIDVERFDISFYRTNYSIDKYQEELGSYLLSDEVISVLSRRKL